LKAKPLEIQRLRFLLSKGEVFDSPVGSDTVELCFV
jgi:hypothetical protein